MPWVYATASDLQSMSYNYYVILISITILIYDFLLTFPSEVERIWTLRRLNWGIALFYLNRYLVIFGYVPILIQNFWTSHNPAKLRICGSLQLYHEYFSAVIQVVVACVSILRIYALYRRNIPVLVCLVGLAALLLVVGSWAAFGGNKEDNQEVLVYVGCGLSMSHYRALRRAAGWAAMFFFDLVVFSLTLYGILTIRRTNASNFLTVFVRDGTMYFGLLTICTLVTILTLLYSAPLSKDVGMSFTNIISSVVMSRLMLNLRDPSLVSAPEHPTTRDTVYPNLTNVEPHYPTELTDRGGFADDSSSRLAGSRHSYEGLDLRSGRSSVCRQ